jgi:hypothetical protein
VDAFAGGAVTGGLKLHQAGAVAGNEMETDALGSGFAGGGEYKDRNDSEFKALGWYGHR